MKTTFTSIALALLALNAQAQSITVLSSGGDARACSVAAELSETLMAARSDLEPCDRAIEQPHLNRRDRAATYVNRGILQARLERYQEALNDYNAALELDAGLPQAWNGKGNLYFLAERYDEAIDAYQRSLDLNLPAKQVAYYNLGLVYEKLGDVAAAEQNYNAALEIAPEWQLARQKLQRLREN